MNTKSNAPNHPPIHDVIASQVDPFRADLKKAGDPANTLCTKRAALRKFTTWRRRRKNAGAEPNEPEVKAFMAKVCKLTTAHRSLASTALFGFLEHLRRHGVIRTPCPKVPDTVSWRLEQNYADFLRNEKGLADLSLRVYLPVAANLLKYLESKQGTAAFRRLDATIVRIFLFERGKRPLAHHYAIGS